MSKIEDNLADANQPITNYKNVSFKGQREQLYQYQSYVYTWKIDGIGELLSQSEVTFESPPFPAFGYPYKAKAKLYIQNGRVPEVSLAFINENVHMNESVPIRALPAVTYTLRDLKGTGQDFVRSYECSFLATLEFNKSYYWIHITKSLNPPDSVYNISDSLIIDIAVEPPSVAKAIASTDGTLAMAIDHFSLRRRRQNKHLEGAIKSPYFYTSPAGYRVQIYIQLNRDDSKFHGLSVIVGFLTGENDSDLSVSFPHKTTIIIFNQVDSTQHFVKTVENGRSPITKLSVDYLLNLLLYDDLENKGFIVDDTLYYKVIVQPSEI